MKKSDIIKYNLKFNHIDSKNPVTIGNGDFAITLDQTGTQSLYEIYKDIPLSTMSNKNWFYKDKKDIKPSYVDGKLICFLIWIMIQIIRLIVSIHLSIALCKYSYTIMIN